MACMTILVTGGAGFVGSHLARALHARGADVRVLDDLSTGHAGNLPATIPLQVGDVRDRAALDRALAGVTQVFHMAAAVGPALVAADPRGTWSRNADGTLAVLCACARRDVKVLLASSSEVYRPAAVAAGRPVSEHAPTGARPGDPRGVYARSKLAGEMAARRLSWSGLRVLCARLFNVVGLRQSPRHGMVLARFAEAARRGEPLPVYDDGMQRRCFLHVEDAVRALLDLAATPAAVGLAVNVGWQEEVTVLELARRVSARAGHAGGVRFVPFTQVCGRGFPDPRVRRPDTRRLEALTGWRPRLGLEDAIADVLGMPRPVAGRRRHSVARSSPTGARGCSTTAPSASATARRMQ